MAFTPQQMGTASMYGSIAGMLTGAIGGFYSAKLQKINLEGQAQLADINARIAELGAQSALDQGQKQVASLTLQAGKLKSSQRAAMAANGIDLGVGSAAEVQASTDIMKEIDKNTLELNAVRNAWGYRAAATNSQNDALVGRATAKGITPLGSGASSLLGSAGQVAGQWYKLNQSGALAGSMFEMKG